MFVSGSPQAIDASTIKDVCTKYIYNRAPAIAAVGTFSNTGRLQRLNLTKLGVYDKRKPAAQCGEWIPV